MQTDSSKIYSCNFEIFGKVQRVFFRKHTQQAAKKLKLNGWCMNTDAATVKGVIEGPMDKLEEMKKWLKEKGSPKSRIDNAVFSEVTEIAKHNFKEFIIRR